MRLFHSTEKMTFKELTLQHIWKKKTQNKYQHETTPVDYLHYANYFLYYKFYVQMWKWGIILSILHLFQRRNLNLNQMKSRSNFLFNFVDTWEWNVFTEWVWDIIFNRRYCAQPLKKAIFAVFLGIKYSVNQTVDYIWTNPFHQKPSEYRWLLTFKQFLIFLVFYVEMYKWCYLIHSVK